MKNIWQRIYSSLKDNPGINIGVILFISLLLLFINVASYIKTSEMLTFVADSQIAKVLENSEINRSVSTVFNDLTYLEHTFLDDVVSLQSAQKHLQVEFDRITVETEDFTMVSNLERLTGSLDILFNSLFLINSRHSEIKSIYTNTYQHLERIENFIGKSLIEETLNGKDTTYTEQILMLVIGYKESLRKIDQLWADLGSENYLHQSVIDTDEIFNLIDDFVLRLQTITASGPVITEHGRDAIVEVRYYSAIILEYFQMLDVLKEQFAGIYKQRDQLTAEVARRETDIAVALQSIKNRIVQTLLISSGIVLLLTFSVFTTQSIINFIQFRQMARENLKRKLLANELSMSKARLQALSDASFEAIFISDRGVCLDQNLTAEKMFGYSMEEAKGKPGTDWIAPEDREKVRENMLSGVEIPYTALAKRKDGTTFPCEIQARMVRTGSKSLRITALRDITEHLRMQKEKEEALINAEEAKKLALVGKIAGKMAHDFNNILTIVMGMSEIILHTTKEEETEKGLQVIFEASIRGKNLTKNLVAFAKDQQLRQQFFSLKEKIDLMLGFLKDELRGIDLTVNIDANVPELFADAGMVEHALVNLLQNAIHALSLTSDPHIAITVLSDANQISIQVQDNGCGIPVEHINEITEPAFTLKGSKDMTCSYKSGIKGTGYGLANVKKYLELHKGHINIESKPDAGTTVTLSLPIVHKELTKEDKIALQEITLYSALNILLVEDEPAISDLQYRILTNPPCSHVVDRAYTGKMAIELLDKNDYDLVSLDYVLSDHINGMDVYHHIRSVNPDLPILFVSGNIEFIESINDLKVNDRFIDHIPKPCNNKDYVREINILYDKVRRAGEV